MLYDFDNVPCGTIEKYIELLDKWNKKINLVSFKNQKELVERHIIDSLQLKKHIKEKEIVFDIGSGAGFPGLMLSYSGTKEMHLVEKIEKKANFLLVASCLSLNKIYIHNCDASEIKNIKADIIVARGLTELESIFNITQNLIKEDTKYFLLKGKNVTNEIKKALGKWHFEYIIHPSITSKEGCILEVKHLKQND